MRSREEDEDSDVASLREPSLSHKKARLAALHAKQKAWNRDLAYEALQASERCSKTTLKSSNRPATSFSVPTPSGQSPSSGSSPATEGHLRRS